MSLTASRVAGFVTLSLVLALPVRAPAQTNSLTLSLTSAAERGFLDHRPDAPIAKPDQPSPTNFREIPEEGVYIPMDGRKRLEWFAVQTTGPGSLVGGLFAAGISTASNQPREYGSHWDGFSKRYAAQFANTATSNLLEAGIGSLWGEDARYVRHGSDPLVRRVGHVFLMTVSARRKSGHLAPAYARYIAISGSNFLANAWWASSGSHATDALLRTGLALTGRLAANAWDEFWPSVRPHILPRRQ